MRTIGILGANGQVGSEVSLLLSTMDGVRVVPFSRSEQGAILLRRCGLECRVGSVADPAQAGPLLAGCDLVADFSLPTGLASTSRPATRRIIREAIASAPPGAPYVYMSSTMAFGMPLDSPEYADRLVSRSRYGADKRYAERLAFGFGRRFGRPVYVLRLGQVHGDLQGVSRTLTLSAAPGPLFLERGGEVPSDAVFCSSIARALVNIADRLDPPGRYTLVESPDWTWRQLFEFYAAQRGVDIAIRDLTAGAPRVRAGGLRSLLRRLAARGMGRLARNKELLLAHVPLPHDVEYRLKVRHLTARVAAEIGEGTSRLRRIQRPIRGPVPGRRLPSLVGDGSRAIEAERKVRRILHDRLGPESHNFPLS